MAAGCVFRNDRAAESISPARFGVATEESRDRVLRENEMMTFVIHFELISHRIFFWNR